MAGGWAPRQTDGQSDWREGWERRESPEREGNGGDGGRSDGESSAPKRRVALRPGHCPREPARGPRAAWCRPRWGRSLFVSLGGARQCRARRPLLSPGPRGLTFLLCWWHRRGLGAGVAPTPPHAPVLPSRESSGVPSPEVTFSNPLLWSLASSFFVLSLTSFFSP